MLALDNESRHLQIQEDASWEHECLYNIYRQSIHCLLRYLSLDQSGGTSSWQTDIAILRAKQLIYLKTCGESPYSVFNHVSSYLFIFTVCLNDPHMQSKLNIHHETQRSCLQILVFILSQGLDLRLNLHYKNLLMFLCAVEGIIVFLFATKGMCQSTLVSIKNMISPFDGCGAGEINKIIRIN